VAPRSDGRGGFIRFTLEFGRSSSLATRELALLDHVGQLVRKQCLRARRRQAPRRGREVDVIADSDSLRAVRLGESILVKSHGPEVVVKEGLHRPAQITQIMPGPAAVRIGADGARIGPECCRQLQAGRRLD
jgi:hypothetical protein